MRKEKLENPLPDDAAARGALEVCRRLQEAGHAAWLAGGCVRDLLLGVAIEDYDIASDASPDAVASLFERTVAVGEAFGVMRVVLDGGPGRVYEVARFRRERGYTDGRHPDHVEPGTPAEDASRRDFTINGLFLDPLTLDIIDHVGGLDDLQVGRIVRAIGDANERFQEDHLRLLRAARFVGRTGFELDPDTRSAVERLATLVRTVSHERVHDELAKLFRRGPARGRATRLLVELGLLQAILPGWAPEPGAADTAAEARLAERAVDRLIDGGTDLAGETWLLGLFACRNPEGVEPASPRDLVAELAAAISLSRRERRFGLECLDSLSTLASGVPDGEADRKLAVRAAGFPAALALLEARAEPDQRPLAQSWATLAGGWGERDLWPHRLLEPAELEEMGVPRGPRLGRVLAGLERAQLAGDVADRAGALAWLERHGEDRDQESETAK